MQVFTEKIYSEYEWNKKNTLMFFSKPYIPFFFHIPKTRLENKYMHAHKKLRRIKGLLILWITHTKNWNVKGLLILWITCCCLFQKIYHPREKCESYHMSQLPEHHNNQRPIPRMDTNKKSYSVLLYTVSNICVQILKMFATRLYIKKL